MIETDYKCIGRIFKLSSNKQWYYTEKICFPHLLRTSDLLVPIILCIESSLHKICSVVSLFKVYSLSLEHLLHLNHKSALHVLLFKSLLNNWVSSILSGMPEKSWILSIPEVYSFVIIWVHRVWKSWINYKATTWQIKTAVSFIITFQLGTDQSTKINYFCARKKFENVYSLRYSSSSVFCIFFFRIRVKFSKQCQCGKIRSDYETHFYPQHRKMLISNG